MCEVTFNILTVSQVVMFLNDQWYSYIIFAGFGVSTVEAWAILNHGDRCTLKDPTFIFMVVILVRRLTCEQEKTVFKTNSTDHGMW